MTNIIHVYVHTTHEEKISCDLYDGHKYINDIFKVISK